MIHDVFCEASYVAPSRPREPYVVGFAGFAYQGWHAFFDSCQPVRRHRSFHAFATDFRCRRFDAGRHLQYLCPGGCSPDQAIRKTLDSLELQLPVESISPSPLNGLYEVKLKGGRVLYASADGQFVVQGYLFQVQNGKPVNLTEKTERLAISKTINAIPASEMVIYPAVGETKSHITVFTDTTCPYCHKLHQEVAQLNKMGVEVRYLAFPRQGLGSPGDEQLQAVWCSKDRKGAMDRMVDGKDIKAAKCDNPVSKQYELGQSIGVNGTPAVSWPTVR